MVFPFNMFPTGGSVPPKLGLVQYAVSIQFKEAGGKAIDWSQFLLQIDDLIESVGDNLCVFCYFDKKVMRVCYGRV